MWVNATEQVYQTSFDGLCRFLILYTNEIYMAKQSKWQRLNSLKYIEGSNGTEALPILYNRWQHRVGNLFCKARMTAKMLSVMQPQGNEWSQQRRTKNRWVRRWAQRVWLALRCLGSSGGSFTGRSGQVIPIHTYSSYWEHLWVQLLKQLFHAAYDEMSRLMWSLVL